MALPASDLVKVVWGGAMAGERWSVGVWFNCSGLPVTTPTTMNTLAADMLTAFATAWTTIIRGANGGGCTLDSAKVYEYLAGVLSITGSATTTPSAGNGTAPQPAYVSRVVTLLTDFAGRSYRGRIYLPWTGQAPSGTTFQWSSSAGVLTALKTCFNACETDILTRLAPATGANLAVVGATHGNVTNVHNLRMDSLPDTQHGRTRKLTAAATDSLAY